MATTGMAESPLDADIPVLMITEAQPGGGSTGMDTKVWHMLPCNAGMDTIKSALPEIPQVSDETVNEQLLTKRYFVTSQTIYPYCREITIIIAKLGSLYLYDRERS